MPVLSRFLGIVIYMHWREHSPPHFHARHQNEEVTVEIDSGRVTGHMGARELSYVQEWRRIHHDELLANWKRAEQKMPLASIDPLD
jgi:hypothetical protein